MARHARGENRSDTGDSGVPSFYASTYSRRYFRSEDSPYLPTNNSRARFSLSTHTFGIIDVISTCEPTPRIHTSTSYFFGRFATIPSTKHHSQLRGDIHDGSSLPRPLFRGLGVEARRSGRRHAHSLRARLDHLQGQDGCRPRDDVDPRLDEQDRARPRHDRLPALGQRPHGAAHLEHRARGRDELWHPQPRRVAHDHAGTMSALLVARLSLLSSSSRARPAPASGVPPLRCTARPTGAIWSWLCGDEHRP